VPDNYENIWQLLYSYESEIYGYIKNSIGNGEIARDLYQDVFLSAIQHLDELDAERSLKNWLYTVARNRVINYLKFRHRRETVELAEHQGVDFPKDHLDTTMIQRIFTRLNPLHRQVLLWHLLDGYSYEEIALKLDRSVSAITSLIHRARENFQKYYLTEYLPGNLDKMPDFQDVMRFFDPLNPISDLFERVERKALEYFSVLNRQWDRIRTDFLEEKDLQRIINQIELPANARIGDLGSGTGFVSLACAARGYVVYAVDINPVMTGHLKESSNDLQLENLHLIQADIKNIPMRKGRLDAMFFTLVLHHLANPMGVLASALSSLTAGGYLIMIDFLRHYEKELADTMHDLWLGFNPVVIEKHMKAHAAELLTSGVIKGKSSLQTFYQIYRNTHRTDR